MILNDIKAGQAQPEGWPASELLEEEHLLI
jgi:hypothetical protein